MISFDVEYLFSLLGGPRGLMDLLDKHVPGNGLEYPAVQMWKQRKRIPADWIARVIYALIREGRNPLVCFSDDSEFV
jgi:hypothetical protein